MSEIEIGGATIRGGKLLLLIPLLGTLGGGLWGGFEFYKDYMDMKEAIQEYTAPDLSGFDKRIDLMTKEMESVKTEVNTIKNSVVEASDYTRDIKNDLKSDIRQMDKIVNQVERETKQAQREMDKDIREFRKEVDSKINKALTNPLSAIAK
jgi:predicted  nucleic acid-binding Zn-ribbon protein